MITPLYTLPRPLFSNAAHVAMQHSLGGNNAHLWLLDINQFTAAHYAEAERIMSSSEHERAQKFVRGRESYIASRWLQRKVLGRYTGMAPEAVEFGRSDKGKPFLPHSDVYFSLSHSGHWALLAVSNIERIGVDIEAVSTTRDLHGIAENYYHPHEFAQLQTLTGNAQQDYFYRLWTLKEAFFKALGTGISAGLENVAFELQADKIAAQMAAKLNCHAHEWQFQQWALSTQDYCALASKSAQPLATTWFDALA